MFVLSRTINGCVFHGVLIESLKLIRNGALGCEARRIFFALVPGGVFGFLFLVLGYSRISVELSHRW